jgi:hypothetical protein
MKKRILLLFIMALSVNAVYADQASPDTAKNTITGGIYTGGFMFIVPEIGVKAEYERILLGNNFLGLAVEAGAGLVLVVFPSSSVAAKVRLYPFSGIFFMEAGIGYKRIASWSLSMLSVPTALGWKIGPRSGGFAFIPSIGLDLVFAAEIDDDDAPERLVGRGVLPFPGINLLMGFSF